MAAKKIDKSSVLLGLTPLALLAWFYSLAAHGHWLFLSRIPDDSVSTRAFTSQIVSFAILTFSQPFIALAVGLAFWRMKKGGRDVRVGIALFIATSILALGIIIMDPGQWIDWQAD